MLNKKRMAKNIVLSLLLSFGLLHAEVQKGPYLIYDGVNTGMTVLWQLDSSQSCTIDWGVDTSYAPGSAVTGESGSGTDEHQHKYTITGLTPGTKYFYQVNCDADSVGNGSFQTAPLDNADNIKFIVYGDTRSYPADHDAVSQQMINTYSSDPEYQTIILHVGDWVNNGDSETDWADQFFDSFYANTNEFQANMPINGVKGNHEGSGVLFEKYFPYLYGPSGFYWSFDYGPAHIAVIDQYVPYNPGSTQYAWLENDLASSIKKWKFLVFHEPGWSAGGHSNNANVQNYIQPLAIKYGVSMIFAGHNHYYARAVVDGIQHVTTGGGGAPLYTPESNAENVAATEKAHHFCEVEILGNDLWFVARDKNGGVFDSFHLNPLADTTPPVITILGDNPLNLQVGDTYTDPGATAQDYVDGNVSTSIQTTSNVNTAAIGTYSVTYHVSDTAGNAATASRTVIVTDSNMEVHTLQSRVSASTDDAEEKADGTMYLNSTDLELVYDPYVGSIQSIGIRFTGLTIPQDTIITRAYIQFKVDEVTSENTQLNIYGENNGNTATFSSTLHDISSRTKTGASISWSPVTWDSVGAAEEAQRTPDLTSIVQEIVSGSEWQNGNAMVFIITGSGQRITESYDGDSTGAPLLYIEYATEMADTVPPVITILGDDPLNLQVGDTYTDPGATAQDNVDGDVSAFIQTTSTVNTAIAGTYTVTYTVSDTAGNTATVSWTVIVSDQPVLINSIAYSDIPVKGTIIGNYTDTHELDSIIESITEQSSGGKPSKRYSYLEHKWAFNVQPGSAMTLFAEVTASASSDGDSFAFAWSTDDITYTTMFTVDASSALAQSYSLDPSTSGTVYVRVVDTDRTAGTSQALDTISVDQLLIRTDKEQGEVPETPGNLMASAISASEISLQWDNVTDEYGYRIGRLNGSEWVEIASVGTDVLSYTDTGLSPATDYRYQVSAYNGAGNSEYSDEATATTEAGAAITLSVQTQKVRAEYFADLVWNGAVTDNVDIYRDDSKLTTVPNSGTYSDTLGKKPAGNYEYKVCEETSTIICSDKATVSF